MINENDDTGSHDTTGATQRILLDGQQFVVRFTATPSNNNSDKSRKNDSIHEMLRIHEENLIFPDECLDRAAGGRRRAMRRQNKFHFCFWPFSSFPADGLRLQCWQKYREFIALVTRDVFCEWFEWCVWVGVGSGRAPINRKLNSRASENPKIISLLICFHRANGSDPFKTYKNKREAVKYVLAALRPHPLRLRSAKMNDSQMDLVSLPIRYIAFSYIDDYIIFSRYPLLHHCHRIFKRKRDEGVCPCVSWELCFSFAQLPSSKCYCFFILRHYHLSPENDVNIQWIHTSYRVPPNGHRFIAQKYVLVPFSISASFCCAPGTRHAPAHCTLALSAKWISLSIFAIVFITIVCP